MMTREVFLSRERDTLSVALPPLAMKMTLEIFLCHCRSNQPCLRKGEMRIWNISGRESRGECVGRLERIARGREEGEGRKVRGTSGLSRLPNQAQCGYG
jgi:hypothetical protein